MADGATLYESVNGLIRTKIEAHGAGLRLFAQRDQNDLVRNAMQAGGQLWIVVFLPQRFGEDYAVRVLGYNPTAAWEDYKVAMLGKPVKFSGNVGNVRAPQPRPFVLTGNFMDAALAGARPEAAATKTKATVRIRIPTAHAMRPETLRIFKTLPAVEVKRVAQAIERALVAFIGVKLNDRMQPGGQPVSPLGGAAAPAARSPFGLAA